MGDDLTKKKQDRELVSTQSHEVDYLLKKYPKFSRDEMIYIINFYGPSRTEVEKAISFITPNNL